MKSNFSFLININFRYEFAEACVKMAKIKCFCEEKIMLIFLR